MDPFLLYALLIIGVGGYLVSVVIRLRKEQEAKRAEPTGAGPTLTPVGPAPAESPPRPARDPAAGSLLSDLPASPPVDSAAPIVDPTPPSGTRAVRPPSAPPPGPATGPAESVLDVTSGIDWPCDLTPLAPVASRPEARDRLTMMCSAPGAVVQAQLGNALVASGTTVEWFTEERAAIQRDGRRGELQVFFAPMAAQVGGQQAFPTAALNSTVVDLWVE